jgi:hypothetical protein
LKATLVPNTPTAKPQVFPPLATSFIKLSGRVGGLHTIGLERERAPRNFRDAMKIELCLFSLAFCDDLRIAIIGDLFRGQEFCRRFAG